MNGTDEQRRGYGEIPGVVIVETRKTENKDLQQKHRKTAPARDSMRFSVSGHKTER
jgi:hypothetical protein